MNFLDVGYFRLARNISKFSDHRIKVGAVISKSKPISAASNKVKTHPKYANPNNSFRGSIHAEIRAIINSDCDLDGADIYVYRETRDHSPAMARPCDYCLSIIEEKGIKNIYYSIGEYPFWRKERIV